MSKTESLREEALAIWQAGVDAVQSEQLVASVIHVDNDLLSVAGLQFPVDELHRIIVVGAGKAGAGMAAAVESQLGSELIEQKLSGWVNVPDNCVRPLSKIQLCGARPAGVNEPTPQGVAGSEAILELVSRATEKDLVIVLLSGGGSALLPAPVSGISLEDKLAVTRFLSHAGAPIEELNLVRRTLSRIKGGGLAEACHAGSLIALIISDVIGDPLEVIASGPTILTDDSPEQALEILKKYSARSIDNFPPDAVMAWLQEQANQVTKSPAGATQKIVENVIIGNNTFAVVAAKKEAEERGYQVISLGSNLEGDAAETGRAMAQQLLELQQQVNETAQPVCLLSGGEPTVRLTETDQSRKGGRNQELVLAALEELSSEDLGTLVLLSGGTDGEDGPTDAAGGVIDAQVKEVATAMNLQVGDFLKINNSYPFLEQTGGLIKTGPTHTNVMDLRVGLVVPQKSCIKCKQNRQH